jgi:hypothetical protein
MVASACVCHVVAAFRTSVTPAGTPPLRTVSPPLPCLRYTVLTRCFTHCCSHGHPRQEGGSGGCSGCSDQLRTQEQAPRRTQGLWRSPCAQRPLPTHIRGYVSRMRMTVSHHVSAPTWLVTVVKGAFSPGTYPSCGPPSFPCTLKRAVFLAAAVAILLVLLLPTHRKI